MVGVGSNREKLPGRATATACDPWSVPIVVAQIPATGLHRVLAASDEDCRRLAEAAGIDAVSDLRAEFTLSPGRSDTVRVDGRVTGQVGQTCVVSLEPMRSEIDEVVELIFAPPEQVTRLSALSEETETDGERPDALFLGIDPYPRKADAVLELPVEIVDPEDHPFAALKALKADGQPPGQ
jgi:hypothetical protein